MRAFWKKDAVLSLKLTDNCYSLAQMINDIAKMRFYALFREADEWSGVDLRDETPLFSMSIGNVVIQRLGSRRIKPAEVTPSDLPCERLFINANDNSDSYRLRNEFWNKEGNLVDLGEGAPLAGFQGAVVKYNLNVEHDLDAIIKYELTHMYGDIHVKDRLLRYKDKGINFDSTKLFIFPGLTEKMEFDEADFIYFGMNDLKPSDFHKNIPK